MLERRRAAHHSMYGVQRIEPASGLIDTLGDEIRRSAELLRAKIAKSFLSVRHCARIEPDVNKVALASHLLARRAYKEYVIDVRAVQVDLVIVRLAHVFRIESFVFERIRLHEASCHAFLDF